MLREAGLAALADETATAMAVDTLGIWLSTIDSGRPTFLKMLVARGVAKLGERQAIANTLGRLRRERRLAL